MGYSGPGAGQRIVHGLNASTAVQIFIGAANDPLHVDVALENASSLPIEINEDTCVQIKGFSVSGRTAESRSTSDTIEVNLSANNRAGVLIESTDSIRVTGETSVAVVKTTGTTDQSRPDIQTVRTSVDWRYEMQRIDICTDWGLERDARLLQAVQRI